MGILLALLGSEELKSIMLVEQRIIALSISFQASLSKLPFEKEVFTQDMFS